MTDFISQNLRFLRRFGAPAILTRKMDSTSEEFVGVFSGAHQESLLRVTGNVAAGMNIAVSSTEPWIWIDIAVARFSDSGTADSWSGAVPKQNDDITVAGVAYRVYDAQPDGQGGLRLILKKR